MVSGASALPIFCFFIDFINLFRTMRFSGGGEVFIPLLAFRRTTEKSIFVRNPPGIHGEGGGYFVVFVFCLPPMRSPTAMTINVYSKPGCGKCAAAKSKLEMMGLEYTERNLEYYVSLHDGWRQDGSADVMAAHTLMDTLPIFQLNGEFHDYPSAMRKLKDTRVAVRV
jgi:hypothetical protein